MNTVSVNSIIVRLLIAGGSGLGILSSMNVHFLVVDPVGRRTGYDSPVHLPLSEIPASRYGVAFTGDPGNAGEDSSREFVASFGTPDHLINGPYTLRVFGEQSGPFWLSISVYREPLSEDLNIRGTIRAGERKTYRLMYAGEVSVPVWIDTLALN